MKSARLSLLILAVVSLLAATAHAGMDLLVSSPSTQSIRRYDSETGAFKGHFVAPGAGGLVQPRGMDVGQDGNLYVADGMVGRVKRFSMVDGSFIDDFTPTDILSPLKLRFSGEGVR